MKFIPLIPGSFLTIILVALSAASALAQSPGPEKPKVTLGIRVYPVDHSRARELGITARAGAVIGIVYQGSPAEKIGLKAGDVVVAFAGKKTATCRELEAVVNRLKVGPTYRIEFYRGDQLFYVNLKTAPSQPPGDDNTPTDSAGTASSGGKTPSNAWVSARLGDLIVELPASWRASGQLTADEGSWSQPDSKGEAALFAVIRDLGVKDLCTAMKVEKQEKTTLAGRPAESYLGTVARGDRTDRRRVLVAEQSDSAGSAVALVFVAPANQWSAVAPTFDRILASVRPASGPPPQTAPSSSNLVPGDLVIPIGDPDE